MTKLVWHIDRAKFVFDESEDYEAWKSDQKVFFEFSPSQADDPGEELFEEVFDIEVDFEVSGPDSKIGVTLEEDGPRISAWVLVDVETCEGFSDESLQEWANEMGGWASASVYLGEYDANIVEDDGGDWRIG